MSECNFQNKCNLVNLFETIQQLQVEGLSPNFLQGNAIIKLFQHLHCIAHREHGPLNHSAFRSFPDQCLLLLQITLDRIKDFALCSSGQTSETLEILPVHQISTFTIYGSKSNNDAKCDTRLASHRTGPTFQSFKSVGL
jgi:hypothetical protein